MPVRVSAGNESESERLPLSSIRFLRSSPTARQRWYMARNEHSVEIAGVNLAGRNHVCAFFNTIDEEHRVLGSFYKDGFDRGEKATHIVDSENREGYLNRLAGAGINVQEMMGTGQLEGFPGTDLDLRVHPLRH